MGEKEGEGYRMGSIAERRWREQTLKLVVYLGPLLFTWTNKVMCIQCCCIALLLGQPLESSVFILFCVSLKTAYQKKKKI